MITKQEAGVALGTTSKHLKRFTEVVDLFNPENVLSGWLCYVESSKYGALIIDKVNDEHTEQIVFATPKFFYPESKDGKKYKWPKKTGDIYIHEKLDGTNVFSYWYTYKGKKFLTYKSRLTPILRKNLMLLWAQCLQNQPVIKEFLKCFDVFNFGFEMCGYLNPILVKYPFPIKGFLLYGVNPKTAEIVHMDSLTKIEMAPLKTWYKISESPHKFHSREHMGQVYQKTKEYLDVCWEKGGEQAIEGCMIYAWSMEDSKWCVFKCKTTVVEKTHRKPSDLIPMRILRITAKNAVREGNDSLIEFTSLLKEEFSDEKIEKSMGRIKRVHNSTKMNEMVLAKINEVLQKAHEQGLSVTENKNDFFRFMSKFFPKKAMRKVATICFAKQEGKK